MVPAFPAPEVSPIELQTKEYDNDKNRTRKGIRRQPSFPQWTLAVLLLMMGRAGLKIRRKFYGSGAVGLSQSSPSLLTSRRRGRQAVSEDDEDDVGSRAQIWLTGEPVGSVS